MKKLLLITNEHYATLKWLKCKEVGISKLQIDKIVITNTNRDIRGYGPLPYYIHSTPPEFGVMQEILKMTARGFKEITKEEFIKLAQAL